MQARAAGNRISAQVGASGDGSVTAGGSDGLLYHRTAENCNGPDFAADKGRILPALSSSAASAADVVVFDARKRRQGRRDARVPPLRHNIQGEHYVLDAHGIPQLQGPVRVQPLWRDNGRQVFVFRSHSARTAQLDCVEEEHCTAQPLQSR